MMASRNGHLEVVRTLLEYGADVEAKGDKVRNQMIMIMMTIILVLTIMMIMRIDMIVDTDARCIDDDNR